MLALPMMLLTRVNGTCLRRPILILLWLLRLELAESLERPGTEPIWWLIGTETRCIPGCQTYRDVDRPLRWVKSTEVSRKCLSVRVGPWSSPCRAPRTRGWGPSPPP